MCGDQQFRGMSNVGATVRRYEKIPARFSSWAETLAPAVEADRRPIDQSGLNTPGPSSASGSSANLVCASHEKPNL